jgi:hypothetical protein
LPPYSVCVCVGGGGGGVCGENHKSYADGSILVSDPSRLGGEVGASRRGMLRSSNFRVVRIGW